jgi:hypothetical protein
MGIADVDGALRVIDEKLLHRIVHFNKVMIIGIQTRTIVIKFPVIAPANSTAFHAAANLVE